MSIQSEIDRINQAKTDLAAAIESKGVTVPPNTTINVYPGLVQQIEQGAGLPTGGTPGQMLYQGESGPEWGDKPVMVVKLTQNSTGQLISDKTGKEIYEAYQAGNAVIAYWYYMEGADMLVPLLSAAKEADQEIYYLAFSLSLDSGVIQITMTDSVDGPYIIMSQTALTSDASHISFTPGTTGLTSDNVQDAIEEVRENSLKANNGVLGEDVYIPPNPDNGFKIAFLDMEGKDEVEIEWFPSDYESVGFDDFRKVLYFYPEGFVKIRGIADPETPSDVTNKHYVDSKAPKSVSVTLPASGWSSNTQTVTVNGVLADEAKQLIQPMPAIASQSAYISAGVICSGQAANSLTFTCQTVPTENLTVYVVIQGVGA